MARKLLALLLVLTLFLSLSLPAAAWEGSYSDVPSGDWAEESIRKAREYGLMQGVGDGRFGYGAYMTRASFLTVLERMFLWDDPLPASPSFSDVAADDWYYSAVERALARQVIEPGLYIHPTDDITREDMAVMLIRALGYGDLAQDYAQVPPFPDVTDHLGCIALASRFGIVNGVAQADGTLLFLPTRSSTRQECAAMLVRTYERYHAPLSWLHGFYAIRSYADIGQTDAMDALSLGWARLSLDQSGAPLLNTSPAGGNEWSVPTQSEAALQHFNAAQVPYNLCIHAALSDRVLVDGTSASPLVVLLASPSSRQQASDLIAAESASYAGVTVDFEGLRAAEKEAFTSFMSLLRAALPRDKALFVCVQPPDWYGGYDYSALGELCDKVILMAHDYQDTALPDDWVGTTHTVDPSAPLDKVCSALSALTDPVTGVADRSKLVLAVSFSTVALKVDRQGRLLETTLYSPSTDTVYQRLLQEDTLLGWDDSLRLPYACYTAGDARYRLWYEDARSVSAKLQLAHMFGVDALSLWRVGILPDYSDEGLFYNVWDALER